MASRKNRDNLIFSAEDQINKFDNRRPHLVILGAGATKAVLPNGDKNNKQIPLMNDLVEILNLTSTLNQYGINNIPENFEIFYSSIHEKNKKLALGIEKKIFDYFSKLKLPNEMTIYDWLFFSLREKDCIATFNWDPLLSQAITRCIPLLQDYRIEPPQMLFLHGNVGVGYCPSGCRTGPVSSTCSQCGKKYIPAQLLYPISQKDYSKNSFIDNQWKRVMDYLQRAYIVTIFGYSAPNSDQEAMKLFQKGWGDKKGRNLEQLEFINIENKDTYIKRWDNFIHTHHYNYKTSYFDSILAKYPRRSCECLWEQFMMCKFLQPNHIPKNKSRIEQYYFFENLISKEVGMTPVKLEIVRQKDGKILDTKKEFIGGKDKKYLMYAKVNENFVNDEGYKEIEEGDFIDITFGSATLNIKITYSDEQDNEQKAISMPRISIKNKGKCTYRLILCTNMRFSIYLDEEAWDKRFLGTFWKSSDK